MSTDQRDIVARNVHKSFAFREQRARSLRELLTRRRVQTPRIVVLEDLSLEIQRGEWVGIIGRNGSGKTTLLKLLAGILEPEAGTLVITRSVVPLLELGIGFHPDLTAEHNIRLNGQLLGMSAQEARQRVPEILHFAGVEAFRNLPLRHYSLGMHLRLAFAVASRVPADILLIDEVFVVGDPTFWQKCEEVFLEMKAQGKTLVLVSQYRPFLEQWCDRLLLLDEGHITLDGRPSQVFAAYEQHCRSERTVHPHLEIMQESPPLH